MRFTAQKVSKYGAFPGLYFPIFGSNMGKYGPEITPYLNSFQAVFDLVFVFWGRFTTSMLTKPIFSKLAIRFCVLNNKYHLCVLLVKLYNN